jgi:hypothetical protein
MMYDNFYSIQSPSATRGPQSTSKLQLDHLDLQQTVRGCFISIEVCREIRQELIFVSVIIGCGAALERWKPPYQETQIKTYALPCYFYLFTTHSWQRLRTTFLAISESHRLSTLSGHNGSRNSGCRLAAACGLCCIREGS